MKVAFISIPEPLNLHIVLLNNGVLLQCLILFSRLSASSAPPIADLPVHLIPCTFVLIVYVSDSAKNLFRQWQASMDTMIFI